MRHLSRLEIERLAERGADAPPDDRIRHLERCLRCREEVEDLRALLAALDGLESTPPAAGFAERVLARVELPDVVLERALGHLPRVAPSAGFADAVLERADLRAPWLERRLAELPRLAPRPGFAGAVLARVRLPLPWGERARRLVRRRRVAFSGVAASLAAITSAAAAWLFGAQGVTPAQAAGFVLAGLADLALRAILLAGQAGYRLGLLDGGSTIADRIDPITALSGVGIAGALGIVSLWVMLRLMRWAEPGTIRPGRAA